MTFPVSSGCSRGLTLGDPAVSAGQGRVVTPIREVNCLEALARVGGAQHLQGTGGPNKQTLFSWMSSIFPGSVLSPLSLILDTHTHPLPPAPQ